MRWRADMDLESESEGRREDKAHVHKYYVHNGVPFRRSARI